MTTPVDRGSRGSELRSVAPAWLPGTPYVALQRLQRPNGAEPAGDAPVTVVFTLEIGGEVAADAAEGTGPELGEKQLSSCLLSTVGIDASWGRQARFAGAGLLTLVGVLAGAAGLMVLRRRRR